MKGRGFETSKCAPKCCEVLSTAVHQIVPDTNNLFLN